MPEVPHVGQRFPGYEFPVERGKIREFARAVHSDDPAYLDDPEPVTPPTFLQTAGLWAPEGTADPTPAIGFDPARLLHGGQEFVFHGPPPRAGAVLTTESWVDRVYDKEGRRGGAMRFVEIVTAYRDVTGEVAAESRMTLIETARPPTETS
jgi:hypothetical protein